MIPNVDQIEAAGGISIIYADPSWKYSDSGIRGGTRRHYRDMTIDEVRALPVSRIAAEDAALFLWATSPLLPEAIETGRAWGFEYKTVAFTWVKLRTKKEHVGNGHWTRANPELCLLFVRGDIRRAENEGPPASVRQLVWTPEEADVFVGPLGKHSAKPPEVRDRIVQLMGDRPRVELFARQKVPGWFAWGDEVEGDFEMGINLGESR